jgi:ribosomal protein S27AE
MYGRGVFSHTNIHHDSPAAAADAARAQSKAHSVERQLRVVNANLAKTMMICEALWEILRDEHGYSEEDLNKKLYDIDMRDGSLDGRNQRKAVKCPECGHTVSSRHPACIYCGKIIDDTVFTIS